MARGAAFQFQRGMLKDERALLVRVAFYAGLVGTYGKLGLFCLKTSMRVMAVRALHRAFEHFVVERLCERRFLFTVAAEAQLRLTLL